ncbi:amidase family protein [Streptomyces sp. NPDC050428]|uniref:amidase family protein n=1 Tax=Streptomyces sp. NPDC050428 TaxID=3155757 RepID=UPI0034261CFE
MSTLPNPGASRADRVYDDPYSAGPPYDSWTPPESRDIANASYAHRLGISLDDIALFTSMAPGFETAHTQVAQAWLAARPAPDPIVAVRGTDPWHAVAYELHLPATADGPLDGLRVALKETVAAERGAPVGAGSALLAGYLAPYPATVATRLRNAGAVISCTTRADNLGVAITGDSSADGVVLNPWSRWHTPGGSSAGAAAAVSAGLADIAIMVDQAGSGRVPAAWCGLISFMPTQGIIPMTGILGFTPRQDRVAVAGRRVGDVALAASVISGGDGHDLLQGPHCTPVDWSTDLIDWSTGIAADIRGLRIGVVDESLSPAMCDPAVAELIEERVRDLTALGASIHRVSIPPYALAPSVAMLLTVHGGVPSLLATQLGSSPTVMRGDPRLVRHITDRRRDHPEWLARTVQLSAAAAGHHGGQPPGHWISMAQDLIPVLTEAWDAPILTSGPSHVDVLLTPTVPTTAPTVPRSDMTPEQLLSRRLGSGIWHTAVTNLTGRPAVTMPAGHINGLPVGMQVTTLPHHENLLLRIAAALEPAGGHPAAPYPTQETSS